MYKTRQKGFTLIELLVVISIIGVLSSIVLTSLTSARAKARDAKRISNLREIQKALEMYNIDNNRYPITRCVNGGGTANPYDISGFYDGYASSVTCATANGTGASTIAQTLSTYIASIIRDPSGPLGGSYSDGGYLYKSTDGTNYCLYAYKTPENMNNFAPSVFNLASCGSVVNGQCTNVSSGVPQNSVGFTTNNWGC